MDTGIGKFVDHSGSSLIHPLPEWAPKRGLLVGWPTRHDTWRQHAKPARQQVSTFVSKLLQFSKISVILVVDHTDQAALQSAHFLAQSLSNEQTCTSKNSNTLRLSVLPVPMNDCWMRDISPVWLKHSHFRLQGLCFRFNAWGGLDGGCYSDFFKDERVPSLLCDFFEIPKLHVDFVLEGGAVTFDGMGTAITTEQSMLCPNRNGVISKSTVERVLHKYAGVTRIIWLPYGLAHDDDTDGHVDNIAIFIAPNHVLMSWVTQGCNAHRCAEARRILEDAVDATGSKLQIHTVPIPRTMHRTRNEAECIEKGDGKARPAGEQLCASYVNIVQTDEAVFVPTFGIADIDEQACSDIDKAFNRDGERCISIVPVLATELTLAGGGIHCLTQFVPHDDEIVLRK